MNNKKGFFYWLDKFFKGLFILIGFLVSILAGSVGGVVGAYLRDLPAVEKLKAYEPDKVARLYADNGEIFAEYFIQKRILITLDQVPKNMINAFLAIEDNNFYSHFGVDWRGIVRAGVVNFFSGKIKEGGSTITQQLAKVIFLTPEKTLERKIKEALVALQLEKKYTKNEILELYLNQIYLGSGAYGVEAAALTYFGKHAKELNTAECALIAGLPRLPTFYSPFNNYEVAKRRRNIVLAKMAELGYISYKQSQELSKTPLKLTGEHNWDSKAPYFSEYLRKYIEDKYGSELLYKKGIKIYTPLNLKMQKSAERALDKGLMEISRTKKFKTAPQSQRDLIFDIYSKTENLEKDKLYYGEVTEVDKNYFTVKVGIFSGKVKKDGWKWTKRELASELVKEGDLVGLSFAENKKDGEFLFTLENFVEIQGAVLALQPSTGYIKAMVGGLDFNISKFNRAIQAKRQPGSAFKPFIYTTALDNGFTPSSIIMDTPVSFRGADGKIWAPSNYDEKFKGPVSLRMGLEESRNIIAVKLLEKVGVEKVVATARRMGIKSPLEPYLSLALGPSVLSLLEITSAYGVIGNQGVRAEPVSILKIEDSDGVIIEENYPQIHGVLKPETAYVMTSMMRWVVERGTAKRVSELKMPIAGKTGTTNDFRDAWFVGFFQDLAAGVFVGYDDNREIGYKETGGKIAAPIWTNFIGECFKPDQVKDFPVPEGVTFVTVDPRSGNPVSKDSQNGLLQAFIKGTEPKSGAGNGNKGETKSPSESGNENFLGEGM
ncbi:MAG: hypothetical protein A2042_01795 [Candidatus Schekmanbacteria bacterium GWA2_38_11]|uniref:peptidoglycan glycosyltransferase n=1 Tax=Candidatus Schekmanbacteria bacterium GWA2_38_11 TaxID=1817876 RepID=A0A1F7RPD3_9BACT|nr:MAG: hypothetical protein A2042_01795 [Candidatus Schekmanbacteria bacterium GWA2_38_11]